MTTNQPGAAWLADELLKLEQKEKQLKDLLKHQSQEMVESLKPLALMKSAVGTIASSKNMQRNILDTSLGIGAGLLAKNWYIGASRSIFKKLTGFIIQKITTGFVTKKMPAVRKKFLG